MVNQPHSSSSGARRVMRQLRELMAAPLGAQERLDRFVKLIAASFVADVCSVYLRRPRGSMELCATEGLAASAVHKTRMRPGEGLVGQVAATARPLNVADAPAHPAFSFHPETAEEGLAAFLGAPILRGGRLLGVLTVQNRVERIYDEEEIETLQTAAMVLAEIIAAAELMDADGLSEIEVRPSRPETLLGRRVTDGVGVGVAVKLEPHVAPTKLIADDPEGEAIRVENAIMRLRASVDAIFDGARRDGMREQSREVLETYRMFAHDRGWLERLKEAARSGLTAEAAVERVRNEHRARLLTARDLYLRERLHDLEDLANRLLRHLSHDHGERPPEAKLPEHAVLVARNLGPAALLERGGDDLAGVLLEEGAAYSHAAIVARALGIPMIGGLDGVLDRLEDGDAVIVDGGRAEALLRPTADQIETYRAKIELSGRRSAEFARDRGEPAVTKDGRRIHLLMNAGLMVDLPQLTVVGAEGIGLFRTEFQFMVSATLPKQAEQTALYRAALDAAGGQPVTFRTLDLGGDKILPYLNAQKEENPALGWRAIRLALDRPALMRYQIRALVAACAGRTLRVMFPLISNASEFRRARDLVSSEIDWATARGRELPVRVEVGAMVETPALAFQLDALLQDADFVSVGANDLLQFFFAADRGNPKLADRYDALSPAALRLFKNIRDECANAGRPVTVCGELAGRTPEALALVALGYDHLSMPAPSIGPIKRLIRNLDVADVARDIGELLNSKSDTVRAEIEEIARLQNAPL